MAALEHEGSGQGPAKRPQVPGLIDAALVPLQSLMHHCWHQVSNSSSRLTEYVCGNVVCASAQWEEKRGGGGASTFHPSPSLVLAPGHQMPCGKHGR